MTVDDKSSCDDSGVTTATRDLTILPLTPERLDDLAELFAEPGDPRWCWCASYRVRRAIGRVPPSENRAVLTEATERGPAPGLIAYRDDRPIGWVSLGPREDYPRLAYEKVLRPVDDRPVWSIVCFVIARRERGRGLSRVLLDAAIEHARSNGATTLEAYPVDTGGAHIPPPQAYKGTLAMFQLAGFAEVARRRANAKVIPRPIVRLEL
jgi:GNAT superfamily N-acetyltransferase